MVKLIKFQESELETTKIKIALVPSALINMTHREKLLKTDWVVQLLQKATIKEELTLSVFPALFTCMSQPKFLYTFMLKDAH